MKKTTYLLLFLLVVTLGACEKDDFCVQNPITPKLILRFYDKEATSNLKSVSRFSAIATSKTDSLFTNLTTDSIAIPLNPNTNQTVYTFKRNTISGNITNNETVSFTIDYIAMPDYVSRSCGFRVEFTDLNLSFNANSWIDSISVKNIENINSQRQAHVQIFH